MAHFIGLDIWILLDLFIFVSFSNFSTTWTDYKQTSLLYKESYDTSFDILTIMSDGRLFQ